MINFSTSEMRRVQLCGNTCSDFLAQVSILLVAQMSVEILVRAQVPATSYNIECTIISHCLLCFLALVIRFTNYQIFVHPSQNFAYSTKYRFLDPTFRLQ
jgi:ABC-type transport system involved in Fe-S cluster assembly fused permease/ATPase subunit